MSGYLRGELEAVVNRGSNITWLPRTGETPAATLARTSPPLPPWTQPLRRYNHGRAVAAAAAFFKNERFELAWAAPLWIGDNDEEHPSDCWKRCLVIANDDGLVMITEDIGDDVDRWSSFRFSSSEYGYVVAAADRPDGIERMHGYDRFGPWLAVRHTRGLVTVEVVLDGGEAPVLPRPTTLVPAMATHVTMGIGESQLPAAARAALEKARADLSWDDEDGDDDDDKSPEG